MLVAQRQAPLFVCTKIFLNSDHSTFPTMEEMDPAIAVEDPGLADIVYHRLRPDRIG